MRGAGSKAFLPSVRLIKNNFKLNFLAVFEPRISGPKAVEVANKLGFPNVFIEDAVGFQGGIWILWDGITLNLSILQSNSQVVTCLINNSWVPSAMYASPMPSLRKNLWKLLDEIAVMISLPWMLERDFNEIINLTEKRGGSDSFVKIGLLTGLTLILWLISVSKVKSLLGSRVLLILILFRKD